MTVVRGGRGPTRPELEAQAREQERAKLEAQLQRAQDLRVLVQRPEFRRFAAWLITESQMFGVPVGWPHDALREWTGRAALGHQVFEATTAADPSFATYLLTLDRKSPSTQEPA